MIRLFINNILNSEAEFFLNEKQVHYLFHVMKSQIGDSIFCFDNQTGEYECSITEINKKTCKLKVLKKTRDFEQPQDIWLLFAPVKKDNMDFIIEKATELGVKKIIPAITKRTNAANIKTDRIKAQVIEASEQCRRVDVPEVGTASSLDVILSGWDKNRVLFFMDETLKGEKIYDVFSNNEYKNKSIAILTGPEGGFSDIELDKLRKLNFARAVTMGKRILRAETAVVASLACWQAISGDWK